MTAVCAKRSNFVRVFSLALLAWCAAAGAPAAQSQSMERPPYRIMPLHEVDGPRGVPAAEWRSTYCLEWTDGVDHCRRTQVSDAPVCARSNPADATAAAQPVWCTKYDMESLNKTCEVYVGVHVLPSRVSSCVLHLWWEKDKRTGEWRVDAPDCEDLSVTKPAGLAARLERLGIKEANMNVGNLYCLRPYNK